MAYPVLGRSDDALDAAETESFLRRRLGDGLLATTEEYGTFTVDVAPGSWLDAVALCRDEELLAYDMFDCLFGVDAGEDGFDVVAILYSTSRGRRILLRGRCEGGREAPTFPSVVSLFPGADWMERETWDMFGIEFEGHASLAPRILCDENFEGWPLRKDFHLATREAKPWPGVKEPAETDEDGNIIEKVPGIGEAVGPMPLDELMAEQARAANPELVAAQEADDVAEDDGGTADELKAEAEAVEAAALDARTESGHVDIADHGAGSASTDEVLAARADNDAVRDPDQVRAEAAEHRAQRAKEIAQDGLVTGTGDGEAVPQGDAEAAFGHARKPDETPKDLADVQDARDRGELPDEAADTSGVESANEPVEGSLQDGDTTDFEKQGEPDRDEADEDDT